MEHDLVDPSSKTDPPNIEQHSVEYILQFISPPSNLQAIPTHALSRALMQRHHFLDISPDTPHEYLSWPSNDEGKAGKEAIDLLEQYYTYAQHHPYRTVYTSDGDYTYGHVALSCSGLSKGIRLVFQWDSSSELWKFHDLKPMPFPKGARSSPQAVSPFSTQVMSTPVLVAGGGSPTSEEDGDDAYWNAYGTDDQLYGGPASASIREPGSEDAYWAQYSAIQGTADSTAPSPHPQDGARKRPQFPLEDDPNPNDPYHREVDLISIPQTTIYPGREPSPEQLAHLLSGLVEQERNSPPTLDIPSSADRELKIPSLERRGEGFHVQESEVDRTPDHALTDAIRGVYKLWKADRGDEIDKYQFLKVVQKAIEEF